MKAFPLAAALALAPLAAPAATIDFTTAFVFDQTYGDVAGVLDVTYTVSFGGGDFAPGGTIWPGGYYGADGDNTRALIAPTGGASIMRVTLQALGGNVISSVGASLAYWTAVNAYPLSVSITGDGTVAATANNTATPGVTSAGFTWASGVTTVVFDLGQDWNIGYQSIRYSLNDDDIPPIPLPAAGWLLLAGIGGLAIAARRRKAG